jgi:hypothetical protein
VQRIWLSKPPLNVPLDSDCELASGILDAWPANEGSGLSLYSAGPQRLAGTLNASVTWTGSPQGAALNFASGGAITTAGSLYNWDRTQAFSVSFWANVSNAVNEQAFLSTLDPASSFRGWEVSWEPNLGLRLFIINAFSGTTLKVNVSSAIGGGTWNHYVVTYNGNSLASGVVMYVNGKLVATTAGFNSLSGTSVSSIPLRFGNRSNATIPFVGGMSDAVVWNRVISPDEVWSLFGQRWRIYRARQRKAFFASAVTTYLVTVAVGIRAGIAAVASAISRASSAVGIKAGVSATGVKATAKPTVAAGLVSGGTTSSLVTYARPTVAAGVKLGGTSVLFVSGGTTLRGAIRSKLYSDLSSLVGQRVWIDHPPESWDASKGTAVSFSVLSDQPGVNLDGFDGTSEANVSVAVWAEDKSDALAVAKLLRGQWLTFSGLVGSIGFDFVLIDGRPSVYRIPTDSSDVGGWIVETQLTIGWR